MTRNLKMVLAAAALALSAQGVQADKADDTLRIGWGVDGVMVNADDEALRGNRQNLLKALRDLFLQVADISQLVVGSK